MSWLRAHGGLDGGAGAMTHSEPDPRGEGPVTSADLPEHTTCRCLCSGLAGAGALQSEDALGGAVALSLLCLEKINKLEAS